MEINQQHKINRQRVLKECMWILFASILHAVGVYVFIQPNNFSPGGFMGIATFLEYMLTKYTDITFLNSGILFFIFNIPLIILAIFHFKKDFVVKTIVIIILDSIILTVLPFIKFPQFIIGPNEGYCYILAAVAGGLLSGASLALILKADGCSGGTEIISAILQRKYPATNISWFIFMLDSSVVVLSAFFYDDTKYSTWIIPTILSLCKMFCASKMAETMIRGFSAAIKFEIITKHGTELGQEITSVLGRTATVMEAKGAYTGTNRQVLICIIRKRQLAKFKKILSRYPETFAYMMATTEVYGEGFIILPKEGEKSTVI